jgi:hypothetical protein
MRTRFSDALAISAGACNPSGIALSIVEACKEARSDGKQPSEDPAVRLMVHQLAYICRIFEFDRDLNAYHNATEECKKERGIV